jgi:hypothetical protein
MQEDSYRSVALARHENNRHNLERRAVSNSAICSRYKLTLRIGCSDLVDDGVRSTVPDLLELPAGGEFSIHILVHSDIHSSILGLYSFPVD